MMPDNEFAFLVQISAQIQWDKEHLDNAQAAYIQCAGTKAEMWIRCDTDYSRKEQIWNDL